MYHGLINQFLVDSTIDLPATLPQDEVSYTSSTSFSHLTIRESENDGVVVSESHLIGRKYGGFLRAYDSGSGLVVSVSRDLKMYIPRSGAEIVFSPPVGTWEEWRSLEDAVRATEQSSLAGAMAINLGVSICSLFQLQIPLHAVGVLIDGRFIAIAAHSGTGKTTLLWTLLDHGGIFANDDVVPVCSTSEMPCTAFPSGTLPAKLSRSALIERGLAYETLPEVLPRSDEYWLEIPPSQRLMEPRPLAAVFVLQPNPDASRVSLYRLAGGAATAALIDHTQGLWCSYPLLNGPRMRERYVSLASTIPVYAVVYRKHWSVLSELASAIRSQLAE